MDNAGDIGAPASGSGARTSSAPIAIAVVLLAVTAGAGGALDCRVPLRRAPWWVTPCQALQRKTTASHLSKILVVW
jgi:hypothetical protein